MNNKIAFFDLDGTLIPNPGSERRFLRFLWKRGKLGWRQLLAALLFFPRYFFCFGPDAGKKNKAYLAALDVAEVEQLGREWAERYFDQLVDERMVREIDTCRQAGFQLVLLTGTPEFLAKPICERLEMDNFIATRCQIQNGRFIAAPPSQHPLDEDKLYLAKECCRINGARLDESVAYGDSSQDYHLLKAAGKAVVVNPDRLMTVQAQNNNWPIITIG